MDVILGSVAKRFWAHIKSKPIEHEDLSITDEKIANVDWSKILNKPTEYNPTRHAERHGPGGDDLLYLDASQITTGHLSLDRLPPAPDKYMVLGVDHDRTKVEWIRLRTAHHYEQAYIPFEALSSDYYPGIRRLWFRSDLNMFTFQDQNDKKWRFGLVGGTYTANLDNIIGIKILDQDNDGSFSYHAPTRLVNLDDAGGNSPTKGIAYYPINVDLEAPIPSITVYADFRVTNKQNTDNNYYVGVTFQREDGLIESAYISDGETYQVYYGYNNQPEPVDKVTRVDSAGQISQGNTYTRVFTHTPTSRITRIIAVWIGLGGKGTKLTLYLGELKVECVGWKLAIE